MKSHPHTRKTRTTSYGLELEGQTIWLLPELWEELAKLGAQRKISGSMVLEGLIRLASWSSGQSNKI